MWGDGRLVYERRAAHYRLLKTLPSRVVRGDELLPTRGRSKPVVIEGRYFSCIDEAVHAFKVGRKKIKEMIRAGKGCFA